MHLLLTFSDKRPSQAGAESAEIERPCQTGRVNCREESEFLRRSRSQAGARFKPWRFRTLSGTTVSYCARAASLSHLKTLGGSLRASASVLHAGGTAALVHHAQPALASQLALVAWSEKQPPAEPFPPSPPGARLRGRGPAPPAARACIAAVAAPTPRRPCSCRRFPGSRISLWRAFACR